MILQYIYIYVEGEYSKILDQFQIKNIFLTKKKYIKEYCHLSQFFIFFSTYIFVIKLKSRQSKNLI